MRAGNSRIHELQSALEARHLENLTRAEVGRALRALSSCYVERRAKLASGAPLETAGKRAAFALYYGPLHFVITAAIVRAIGFTNVTTIHDLGCGTGVGGAAWALEMGGTPAIAGIDRSAWAVDEANWLYRQLTLRGKARKDDVSRALRPRKPFQRGDALLFAYSLNELPAAVRAAALEAVAGSLERGASLLVIEPIGRRLGNEGWWEDWGKVLGSHGAHEQEWRFPGALLPEETRTLGRAAGLDPNELTARSYSKIGFSGLPNIRRPGLA
jgi:hypothetical protein